MSPEKFEDVVKSVSTCDPKAFETRRGPNCYFSTRRSYMTLEQVFYARIEPFIDSLLQHEQTVSDADSPP